MEDLVGVRVDAARKLAKDPLLRRDALMGDDCIAPILRFVMDAVRDCVLTFRIGATVGAAYMSGIFGTGGALTGVENALDVEVFIEGIDLFILRLAWSIKGTYFNAFVGVVELVAPSASAVPKLALAFVNLITSYCQHC